MDQKPEQRIIREVSLILLNYIKFLPLSYVFAYTFLGIVVLVVNTPLENKFFYVVSKSLGINGETITLDAKDITTLFMIWWFLIGTSLQLLSKLINFHIKRDLEIIIFSGFLILLTAGIILKVNSLLIPIFLLFVALVHLLLYRILSTATEKLFKRIDQKLPRY